MTPTIAFAQVDSGPPVPCTVGAGTVVLQDTVTIRAAGALLPLAGGAPDNLLLQAVNQSWRTSRSSVVSEVTSDSTSEPLFVDDFSRPSVKSRSTRCPLAIEGRRATVTTYLESASSLLGGRYVAIGSYELAPDTWLVIASASGAPAGQREMVASLRAVRFLPPFGSKERHTPKTCPAIELQADTSQWKTYTLRSAPVTFKAPVDAHLQNGYAVETWEAIGTRIDFATVGDRWTIEPLANAATLWCSFSTPDGLPGELAIVPAVQQIASEGFRIGIAYVRLASGRSLSVFTYLSPKSEGPPPVKYRPIPELQEEFRALVSSIRLSK